MKQNSQKLIFFLSKITCAFAMAIAVLSVNSFFFSEESGGGFLG